MTRRNRLIWLVLAPGAVAVPGVVGCLQELDPDAATGGGIPVEGGSTDARNAASPEASGGQVGPCPSGEVCSSPGTNQCALDSPECFYLCGAPLCALGPDPNNPDAAPTIPQAATVPPVFVGGIDTEAFVDGSTTTDPCVQIEAESLAIRQRSCAPCHNGRPPGPSQGYGNLNFVMNDSVLAASQSAEGIMTDGGALAPYIVPGNPPASLFYQKVAGGSMPPSRSLCENLIGYEAGAGIVYATPADVSILYAWILDCFPGTDGGGNASTYGGGLGGTTCFGPCGDAGGE
jgi:hypothetical protein